MRRSVLIVTGVGVLVLLLAGAAFVGGRLLNDEPAESNIAVIQGSGRSRSIIVEPDVAYAGEIPDSPPAVTGLFARRKDNSLFIQSGETTLNIKRDDQGNVELETHADGPEVEVIVTHDTLLYRDDTFTQYSSAAPSGSVQQVLNPGTLDEIGEHGNVQAWGKKRGDRIVAEVIVYAFPAMLK